MAADRSETDKTRIDEELVCVDSLKHVLIARCGCREISILREKSDPPDFTVTIDGMPFPTEVTSVAIRQQYHAHCTKLANFVSERAKKDGLLLGTYAIKLFREPVVPKLQSVDGRNLVGDALAYIEATKACEAADEFQLAKAGDQTISIVKLSPRGALVGLGWMSKSMWEGEIRQEISELIQQRIDDKKKKLSEIGIGPGKALLLLYGAYAHADGDDAAAAMNQVCGYDWFHSVFWAASFADRKNTTYPEEPGREGLFLYSEKPEWHRVGTVSAGDGT